MSGYDDCNINDRRMLMQIYTTAAAINLIKSSLTSLSAPESHRLPLTNCLASPLLYHWLPAGCSASFPARSEVNEIAPSIIWRDCIIVETHSEVLEVSLLHRLIPLPSYRQQAMRVDRIYGR